MELYQAINESSNINFDCPWKVKGIKGKGYRIERDYSHHHPLEDAYSTYGHDYGRYIHLKRGGIRIFKSIDAACNAVREIGQAKVEVIL